MRQQRQQKMRQQGQQHYEAAEAAAYEAAENEATEAAAAQTWHDEREEEDDAMVIDTLRALRRLDLSMLSTRSEHRDCEAAATEVKAAAEVEQQQQRMRQQQQTVRHSSRQ